MCILKMANTYIYWYIAMQNSQENISLRTHSENNIKSNKGIMFVLEVVIFWHSQDKVQISRLVIKMKNNKMTDIQ